MFRKFVVLASILIVSAFAVGCKGTHNDVVEEHKEAHQEIGEAQQKVNEQKAKNADRINEAAKTGNPTKVEDEKVRATEKLADAEKKVEDEKVEATKEITSAEKAAGESTGTLHRE